MGGKSSKSKEPKSYYTITESNNNQGFVSDDDETSNLLEIAEKRRKTEMQILQQLKEEKISLTNHRTGGIAFYLPVDEKRQLARPPILSNSFQRSDNLSFNSEERQIIADIMHRNNLKLKGDKARIQEEKILKAAQRRAFMDMERKAKHEKRMKRTARVRELREEKLRQVKKIAQNSCQHTYYPLP